MEIWKQHLYGEKKYAENSKFLNLHIQALLVYVIMLYLKYEKNTKSKQKRTVIGNENNRIKVRRCKSTIF